VEDIGVISKGKDARSRRIGSQQVLGPDDGVFRPGLEMMTMQAMDEDDALGKSKAIWYIDGNLTYSTVAPSGSQSVCSPAITWLTTVAI
jgi:hypothetical protein